MKGLELSRKFYFDCVKPVIEEKVPGITGKYAAALIGYGSDVIGNDDEISKDHEWGPRCHLFLEEAVFESYASNLDEILNEILPLEYSGLPTRFKFTEYFGMVPTMNETGQHHVVITTCKRFMELTLGVTDVPKTDFEWLAISEQRLLEFTSGEVFEDNTGELTGLRTQMAYFPEDVWLYRMAFVLESLGWSDDLISECALRRNYISMHLNTGKTVERIMKLVFLVNRRYAPLYAKWLHREFNKLPEIAGEIETELIELLENNNHEQKTETLNRIYGVLLTILNKRGLCEIHPARFKRDSSDIRYDIQTSANDVFSKITGDLKNYAIEGIPVGAIDQWMFNEDIVTSANHIKSLLPVYRTEPHKRNEFDNMI